ncbi:MAG: hypothetical protein Q8P91_01385 [bacterium]|nr:hypothetical protein [bacterium]
MKQNKFKILALAIVLRILVAALLFHPDIKTYNFQASFLKKGVVDIYSYLSENKQTLPLKDGFVYFPSTYFIVGGYQAIISGILGSDFDFWLNDAGSNSAVANPNIFKYLTFLKLPLLLMDVWVAFLLVKYFKDRKKGEKAFIIWLFNPFTIILIYAFSNIDLYSVLLTVISFLYIKRKKYLHAAGFMGLASTFKLYPLLFLPFLFLKGKNIKEKMLVLAIPIIILGIVIVPFWSPAFVESALISGLTTRIFSPGFTIGFGESIIVGLFLLSALFFYGWLFDKKIKLFSYWAVMLLVIFSFSHFHIAWLLWIAPFLVISAVKNTSLTWPLFIWASVAMAIPLFYQDRSMSISLFRIYTTWYDLLPTPFTVMQKFYDPYSFQSMMHSVLAGAGVLMSYKILKDNN